MNFILRLEERMGWYATIFNLTNDEESKGSYKYGVVDDLDELLKENNWSKDDVLYYHGQYEGRFFIQIPEGIEVVSAESSNENKIIGVIDKRQKPWKFVTFYEEYQRMTMENKKTDDLFCSHEDILEVHRKFHYDEADRLEKKNPGLSNDDYLRQAGDHWADFLSLMREHPEMTLENYDALYALFLNKFSE
ncbi:MAG: hypothetical protein ACYCQJ_14470 [Nitrososphaerales archaeon]